MAIRKAWPGDRIQQAFAVLQSRFIMQDELLQLKATALQLGSTEGSKMSNTLLVLSDLLSSYVNALNATLHRHREADGRAELNSAEAQPCVLRRYEVLIAPTEGPQKQTIAVHTMRNDTKQFAVDTRSVCVFCSLVQCILYHHHHASFHL